MSSKQAADIQIKINGKQIALNEFVKTVTTNLVNGLVDSLKLDEEPHTIEIELKK